MGQGEIPFTVQGHPISLIIWTKRNGFKGREQDKPFRLASRISACDTQAVKIWHWIPVPELAQHRAKPVVPPGCPGGKKLAIPTQPKDLVVECNCTRAFLQDLGLVARDEQTLPFSVLRDTPLNPTVFTLVIAGNEFVTHLFCAVSTHHFHCELPCVISLSQT